LSIAITAVDRFRATPAQTRARIKIEEHEAADRNAVQAESQRVEAARQAKEMAGLREQKALCKLKADCAKAKPAKNARQPEA